MRRRDYLVGALSAGVLSHPGLRAQSPGVPVSSARLMTASDRRRGFDANMAMRAAAITSGQFAGISNRPSWEAARPEIQKKLRWELGLPADGAKTALHAQRTSQFEREGYSVENVVFQSLPGFYVTGNLYIPKQTAAGKAPAVIYVCGHSPSPLGAKISYQHHAIWFARHGFVAFVLDTIEFGEISGIHHGTHNLEMWQWLSLGYNPAGVEVWNAIRALDYLETRPEVDAARIAITGRSGGGAVSWFAAAVDERFAVASPVHGTWAVGPHVRDHTVRENCDCIYVWNSELLDLSTIGALIAPRPLLIVNGLRDVCFPPAGYNEVERQLKPVYEWYGADDRFATFEDDTGHEDTPAYRKVTNLWISRWLTGKQPGYTEEGIQREPDSDVLRVLAETPRGARNEGIDRSFVSLPVATEVASLQDWTKRSDTLREIVTARLLKGIAPRTTPFEARRRPLQNWTTRYAEAWSIEFKTEEHLTVSGQLFLPQDSKNVSSALIYIKGAEDLVYGIDYDDILSLLGKHVVLVLRPRAVDYAMTSAEMAEAKMSAALMGTTLETLQVHDVLRSVDFLFDHEELPLDAVSVYGRKSMAMVAFYSGAVEERISRVIVDRPPATHWEGPAVMHALRYTDIPEIGALVAPREIAFLGTLPPAYARTEQISRLYPNGKQIRLVHSLGDALNVDGSI